MMLLSSKELANIYREGYYSIPIEPMLTTPDSIRRILGLENVAKAQLKKVVEWGEEFCREHPIADDLYRQRKNCGSCWQSLLKELE